MSNRIFNTQALRAEIVGTWGEHGAHAEVFDMLVAVARLSEAVPGLCPSCAPILSNPDRTVSVDGTNPEAADCRLLSEA